VLAGGDAAPRGMRSLLLLLRCGGDCAAGGRARSMSSASVPLVGDDDGDDSRGGGRAFRVAGVCGDDGGLGGVPWLSGLPRMRV
jgi:hypothetical protein